MLRHVTGTSACLLKESQITRTTFIRRPRGPLLQASPRVTNRRHQVQPAKCLRSPPKPPVACLCYRPPHSTATAVLGDGKDISRGASASRQTRLRNELSNTRLSLPDYPRLFQQPPLCVYLQVTIQGYLLTVLQLYRKNTLKRLQGPGFH